MSASSSRRSANKATKRAASASHSSSAKNRKPNHSQNNHSPNSHKQNSQGKNTPLRRTSSSQSQSNPNRLTMRLLARIWFQWQADRQIASTPLALDKWLKQRGSSKALSKDESPQQRWLLQQAMIDAQRYQQLACALEYGFQQQQPPEQLDLDAWDQAWHDSQLDDIDSDALWSWISLRSNLHSKPWFEVRSNNPRIDYFASWVSAQQQQAASSSDIPALSPLNLLWHGLRPQWAELLAERAELSNWSDAQQLRFLQQQSQRPPLWLRLQKSALPENSTENQAETKQAMEAMARTLAADDIITDVCQITEATDGQRRSWLQVSGGASLYRSEAYQQGLIEVQDYASQQIANAVNAQPGDKIWDCCAGAGGKTLALSSAMTRGGKQRGSVVATDLHPYKLQQLKRRAKRAELLNIRTFGWDGSEPLKLPAEIRKHGGFDRILIDAPCTSAGTWRRNPDARWRFNPEDSEQLQQLQAQLLNNACQALRPGGELVYATCSWAVSENEQQVASFLASHPQFECVEQRLFGAPEVDADCMFVARLKLSDKSPEE